MRHDYKISYCPGSYNKIVLRLIHTDTHTPIPASVYLHLRRERYVALFFNSSYHHAKSVSPKSDTWVALS